MACTLKANISVRVHHKIVVWNSQCATRKTFHAIQYCCLNKTSNLFILQKIDKNTKCKKEVFFLIVILIPVTTP